MREEVWKVIWVQRVSSLLNLDGLDKEHDDACYRSNFTRERSQRPVRFRGYWQAVRLHKLLLLTERYGNMAEWSKAPESGDTFSRG